MWGVDANLLDEMVVLDRVDGLDALRAFLCRIGNQVRLATLLEMGLPIRFT
jgi:hypothetical protein